MMIYNKDTEKEKGKKIPKKLFKKNKKKDLTNKVESDIIKMSKGERITP